MTTLALNQQVAALKTLGWTVPTKDSVVRSLKDFQIGWNLGPALTVDGLCGPATSAALLASVARRRAGLGTCSAHFSFSEFACACGGRYPTCRRIWILRAQVQSLEVYRAHSGPLRVVSGCRCNQHNVAVGGASSSQHLFGAATDVDRKFSPSTVQSWKVFAGIGYGGKTNLVAHVDRRDRSGHNTTNGSVTNPTKWVYSTW